MDPISEFDKKVIAIVNVLNPENRFVLRLNLQYPLRAFSGVLNKFISFFKNSR